jgi:hypothetical protein
LISIKMPVAGFGFISASSPFLAACDSKQDPSGITETSWNGYGGRV